MSKTNPGGHDYVPTSTVVLCNGCDAPVTLLKGDVLRKHLDQGIDSSKPRPERICRCSGTGDWRAP